MGRVREIKEQDAGAQWIWDRPSPLQAVAVEVAVVPVLCCRASLGQPWGCPAAEQQALWQCLRPVATNLAQEARAGGLELAPVQDRVAGFKAKARGLDTRVSAKVQIPMLETEFRLIPGRAAPGRPLLAPRLYLVFPFKAEIQSLCRASAQPRTAVLVRPDVHRLLADTMGRVSPSSPRPAREGPSTSMAS